MERLELTILRNLVYNEDYSRKVIPFIQPDYFEKSPRKSRLKKLLSSLLSMVQQSQLKHLVLK